MTLFTDKSECGLRFAFRRVVSPVAYCALSIKTGTRDENPFHNGIAHFTEHMLFKGTEKRKSGAINSYLEKLGGELNAYTTKEETVIHATVLAEDLPKALELLSDIAFNSIFPEKEIQKERGVILEEISSYKDSPSELIFDDFDELLFAGHSLSMPILGTPKSIKKIDRDALINFTRTHFRIPNMSLSIVADIDFEKGKKLADKYFAQYASTEPEENSSDSANYSFAKNDSQRDIVLNKKTFQAHCIIGSKAYSFYDKNRLPAALLTNILGGPALNSRLNLLLREKHALAYSVDASCTSYSDTGIFSVYFGTDKSNLQKCRELIEKEFALFREKEISAIQLKAAKKQLLGQLAISSDNAESQCLNMGKSLLVFGKVEPIAEIRAKIEAISAEDIHRVANEMFCSDSLYSIIYK